MAGPLLRLNVQKRITQEEKEFADTPLQGAIINFEDWAGDETYAPRQWRVQKYVKRILQYTLIVRFPKFYPFRKPEIYVETGSSLANVEKYFASVGDALKAEIAKDKWIKGPNEWSSMNRAATRISALVSGTNSAVQFRLSRPLKMGRAMQRIIAEEKVWENGAAGLREFFFEPEDWDGNEGYVKRQWKITKHAPYSYTLIIRFPEFYPYSAPEVYVKTETGLVNVVGYLMQTDCDTAEQQMEVSRVVAGLRKKFDPLFPKSNATTGVYAYISELISGDNPSVQRRLSTRQHAVEAMVTPEEDAGAYRRVEEDAVEAMVTPEEQEEAYQRVEQAIATLEKAQGMIKGMLEDAMATLEEALPKEHYGREQRRLLGLSRQESVELRRAVERNGALP